MTTVVVLTALNVEYRAVRRHLTDVRRQDHEHGTVFEVGRLAGSEATVALAVVGEGNVAAAVLTERAIGMLRPAAVLFVGVAGSLKGDVGLGDVVVATKIYSFHGGRETDAGFRPRPRAWEIAHRVDQLARYVDNAVTWWPGPGPVPPVHFKPIAAGEVVLNSRTTPLAEQLRTTYGDAVAIEMESAGVAHAGHLTAMPVATVRGISDLADGGKEHADGQGWQQKAAENAAGFAMALAGQLAGQGASPAGDRPTGPGTVQYTTVDGGSVAYVVAHGSIVNHPPLSGDRPRLIRPAGLRWERLTKPVDVQWREDLIRSAGMGRSAIELHLVPDDGAGRLEVRRLAAAAEELRVLGRSRGHFGQADRVDVGATDRMAWAEVTEYRSGPAGLAVTRDRQLSAWCPLPADMMGAVLDKADLVARLTRMIDLLVAVDGQATGRVAPAVGTSGAGLMAEGSVSSMPRSSASPRLGDLRPPVDDALPFEDLVDHAADVAEELTERLLAAFRNA